MLFLFIQILFLEIPNHQTWIISYLKLMLLNPGLYLFELHQLFIFTTTLIIYMFKIDINKKHTFETSYNGRVELNASIVDWDFVKIDDRNYHIIRNNKSYHAELIIIDRKQKKLELKINGKFYSVEVKDKLDLLLEKLGINGSSRSIVKQVKAPMPGLILSINAIEGEKVKMGDALLVLEAMKMENIIKSPADGVIKKIEVYVGDSVEKNQVLVQF